MKKLFLLLLLSSTSFFLSACNQSNDPKAVYGDFSKSIKAIDKMDDNSINKYLSKRAIAKKNEGVSQLNNMSKDQRTKFGALALLMLKQTGDWLELDKATLDIKDKTASLIVSENTMDTVTNTTLISFVQEDGWKIDYFSKETKDSDPKDSSSSSESIFK